MIPTLREAFNRQFTVEKYQRFLQTLDEAVGMKIDFRVCESPIFLPEELQNDLQRAAVDLVQQLMAPAYLEESRRAVPGQFRVPNDDAHPVFLAVDFAITLDVEGRFEPKLIELQGFPSLYAFQMVLAQTYRRCFGLERLRFLLNGLAEADYLRMFKQAVIGKYDPENVILMEIEPEKQKTAPDFYCTERFIGVKPVCITAIKKRGRKLYYSHRGNEIPIHRIYNRVIVDEFIKKGVTCDFDFRDDLDVEWAGHPNWYFRMSKFSLPYLDHPAAPKAVFLHRLERYPENLSNYVLKPLFSFAGAGVLIDPTAADLEAIPKHERQNYLLQEKIVYGPVIQTPNEPSKVEVRLMFLWNESLVPVNTLARLSKGKMMGVDHNKNKDWVGASACLFE
jgi:uncharacterized protein (UPF0248 family)